MNLALFKVPAEEQIQRMRKAEFYEGSLQDGRALFARAPAIHLATTGDEGHPILRTLHAVLDEDERGPMLAFHGSPVGEKTEGLGRRAVAEVSETVASIPSYLSDPERACPATTYFESAQIQGVLEEVRDQTTKARVLQALMEKFQPEGGHVPIRGDDPLYRKAVAGILVAAVRIERLSCKIKMGQNKKPEERTRILEGLWKRGSADDVRAIGKIRRRFPDLPCPSFLRAPASITLHCDLDDGDLDEAAALLEGAYWLVDVPPAMTRHALGASQAIVGAKDEDGKLVSFARALSDRKTAWIYDVIVAPHLRGRGVGDATMALLLDHPAVRSARRVRLATRDAMPFYRRMGFIEIGEGPSPPYPSVEMVR